MKRLFLVVFIFCSIPLWAQHCVITPDGTETEKLQAALEKCSASTKNCIIEFAEGNFNIGPVAADNFHGTIRGVGLGKTILDLKGVQLKDGFYYEPPSAQYPQSNMFTFRGGDIEVSNLTMRALDPKPFPPYCYFEGACDTALGSFVVVLPLPGSTNRINSRFFRVGMVSGVGSVMETPWAGNTYNSLFNGGMFFQPKMMYGGSHVVRDCFFDRGNIFVLGTRDVRVQAEGNTFRRTPAALDAWQMDGSHIEFTRNDVESLWTGISASQFTSYDPDGWFAAETFPRPNCQQ